jgi:photosystem II stability/assembly factor-like uncharacterized protein
MKTIAFILAGFSLLFAVASWHSTGITLVGVGTDADIDGSGGAQVCTDQGRIYKYVTTGLGDWVQVFQAPSTSYQLNSIDLQNANNGWSGGNIYGFPGNCMFHYTSGSWSMWSSLPQVSPIWDLCFYDQYRGWSAGGDIMYWDNSNWIVQTPGSVPSAVYYGVSNYGFNFVEAVGSQGASRIAIRFNGSIWTQDTTMPSGAGALYCCWMLTATDGWAAGSNGSIFHFNGSNWTSVASPVVTNWNRMWFLSYNNGWMVGDGGKIAHWNGANWIEMTSPTTQNLYAIVFLNASNGWAFGNSGVVIHYYYDDEVESTSLGMIKASFQ